MKNIILIFLFFGCMLDCSSQITYKKYLDQTVRWTYQLRSNASGSPFFQESEYSIQVDTLVENVAYWNVYARHKTNANGVFGNSYGPSFGMRETPDKKFYQRCYNDNKEMLMVDFDLEIGDTLYHNIYTVYVQNVGTIMFGNEKRLFSKPWALMV